MSLPTNRDYTLWAIGSVIGAGLLACGIGLIFHASWQAMIGGTMVLAVIMFALTVKKETETTK